MMVSAKRSCWILAALLPLGCKAAGTEAQAKRSAQTSSQAVEFSGTIDNASVDDFARRLSKGTKAVVIESVGGRGDAAIRLGRLVRERNLKVIVRGYCLSACAHFVFAPARNKSVEPLSIVAFHQTSTAYRELMERAGRPDVARDFDALAKAEQDFYKEAGLSRDLLIRPFIEVAPVCYLDERDGPLPDGRTLVRSRASFFVPTLDHLRQWSVKGMDGFWPATGPELMRALPSLPERLKLKLNFRMEAVQYSNAPTLPAISHCASKFTG